MKTKLPENVFQRLQEIRRAHARWLAESLFEESLANARDSEMWLRHTPLAEQRAWTRIAETVPEP